MTAAHDTQALAEARDRLKNAGNTLANIAYNLAQKAGELLTSGDTQMLDQVRREWDAARTALASRLQEQEGQPALSERAKFEADAAPMDFDLTRHQCLAPEPWSEYADESAGHRWGGWLARATLAAGSQAVQVPGWRPIDSAPTERTAMFVARGFNVDSPRVGARNYTTDPYCVMPNGEGWWHRWPHTFPPTHWMEIPPLQPLAGGEVVG